MEVSRIWIENDLAMICLGCTYGLRITNGLAKAVLRPIICTACNSQYHLFTWYPCANIVKYFFYPVLVRKIACVASIVMLVDSHNKQEVVNMLQTLQVISIIFGNNILSNQVA